MNKILTLLLVTIGLVAASYGADVSVTPTSSSTNQVVAGRASVALITVTATTANAVTASFYDNGATNKTYITTEYLTRTRSSATWTNIWTNTLGILQTNIFTGQSTTVTTNAAATNTLPTVTTFAVPASGSVTKVLDLTLVNGLVAVVNTNCTITVTYDPTP